MYFKMHERNGHKVLAACDEELIGKVLEEKDVHLDLAKHASFYQGEKCTEEGLLSQIPHASSINLVGKKSVAAGMKAGLFGEGEVKYINGIPHIQIYRM